MKKSFLSVSALLVSASVLVGCSNLPNALDHGGNPFTQPANYKKAQTLQSNETTFKGALIREYKMLSKKEADIWSDWFDSDFFARKALKVAKSDNGVPPEDPAQWRFSKEELKQFEPAYTNLVTTLSKTVDTLPVLSAIAQARFDCWVEEQEEGWQTGEIALCKGDFIAAMEDLNGAAAQIEKVIDLAKLYTVFFDFDSTAIPPVGQQVLQALVEDWGNKAAGLSLTGHADRAGAASYNKKLSLRRAQAVKDYVSSLGMAADKLATEGAGESEPAVLTPDGVREPRNRRVVIAVE